MNAKTIEGLKALITGLTLILEESYQDTEESVKAEPTAKRGIAPKATAKPAPAPAKEEPKKATVPAKKSGGGIDKATLDAMTYNNLKVYAKEHNVSAVGNRDEITERILSGGESAPTPATKTTPAQAGKTPGKPSLKGKTAPEPEPEPEEEDDSVRAQVEEAIADTSDEDLASILADIGDSPKGKRQALIDKIVKAVEEGRLSFGDDEEESSEESESSEEEGEDEDNVNDLENPDMTEERREAIVQMDKDIRKEAKSKKLKRDAMIEFLQQFYDTDEDMSDLSDEDVLNTYIDAACRLINDAGEMVEEGYYELNGQPACCGRLLNFVEEDGTYVCEACGTVYETE
jgi:hypothetical protein